VPGCDVEGGVILGAGEEGVGVFGYDGPVRGESGGDVGCDGTGERGGRNLEIARVGERAGADWAQLGELEMSLIEFADVPAGWSVWECDAISDTTGDDCYLVGSAKLIVSMYSQILT